MHNESSRFVATTSTYERFFSLALDMLCVASLEGYFLRLNPAFTQTLGWSEEELLGKPFLDFVHPDDIKPTLAEVDKLSLGASVLHFENRYRTIDGRYRWLTWTSAPEPEAGLIYAVARDITEIKEYEASLQAAEVRTRETERLYRQILDSTEDLILAKGRGSRILWGNEAFRRYYGMSSEKLQGIIDAPHVQPDITQRYVQDDLQVWTTGKPLHIPEEPVTRHDGEVRYWETVKTPIFDTSGAVTMTVGVSRDITERRRVAEELRAAKEAAEHANRAKSVFLANMSHELRTPLNAILGYAQLMAQDEGLSEEHREAAATIQRSGEHLLLLIGDVLDIAKIEAGKLELRPTEFQLGGFVKAIASLFEMRAAQKRLAFHHSIALDLPVAIRADETRLRQVLINLLGNAIKFTERGSVSLAVSVRDGALRFEVTDTGIGIPSEQLTTIFQPFEQVRSSRTPRDGAGLGLAISSQLVSMMGGRIEVRSEPGKGSTFWFEIRPEIVAIWRERDEPAPVVAGYEGPRRKVLIVDDKAENRRVLALLLEPLGFGVLEAEDGEQAVSMARAERPDAIFMDLVMPRLDGFEATRRIRGLDELRGVRIIAASASVFEHDQERSRNAGCDAFVAKPIKLAEALAILGKLLDLTWRYRSDGRLVMAEPAPAPRASAKPSNELPVHVLQRIYDAATIGDIRAILSILEAAGAGRVAPESTLAGEIQGLAKKFQSKKIKALIEPLLGREREP